MKKTTQELHRKILTLVAREREILAQVLEHLQIVQDGKLFLEFGHDSLIKYCVKELKYSESAAWRRFQALRVTAAVPETIEHVRSGELSLSLLANAQSLFEKAGQENGGTVTPEKKRALLEEVKNSSARDGETKMREHLKLAPKPRRLTIEMQEESFAAWLKYKGEMLHKRWSDEKLLMHLLAMKDEERRWRAAAPTVGPTAAVGKAARVVKPSKFQHYIGAQLKRQVFALAQGRCQAPGCTSTTALEYHHVRPIAQNGQSVAGNIVLLCRQHHAHHHRQQKTTTINLFARPSKV